MANQKNIQVDSLINEINAKYQKNGLTYVSNIPTVNKRDAAGNIEFNEGIKNPLVIIEPVSTNIETKSILKVLNTQFNYFKFPARTVVVEEDPLDIDLDVDILDLDQDPIFARYKPSENRTIVASSTTPSGILMDEVEAGLFQKNTNRYYISKEIVDLNTPIRFRIKLTTEFTSTDGSLAESRQQFTIIKSNSNGIDRFFLGPFNMPGTNGNVQNGVTNVLELDITLQPDDFAQGDTFGIGAYSSHNNNINFHTIIAQESFWSITDASLNVDTFNNEI